MSDKEEQQGQSTYVYLDGNQIAMKYTPETLKQRLHLSDADLDWLADEVGKRLAKRMRANGGVIPKGSTTIV